MDKHTLVQMTLSLGLKHIHIYRIEKKRTKKYNIYVIQYKIYGQDMNVKFTITEKIVIIYMNFLNSNFIRFFYLEF